MDAMDRILLLFFLLCVNDAFNWIIYSIKYKYSISARQVYGLRSALIAAFRPLKHN